jgi:signal transduction histidine kinase
MVAVKMNEKKSNSSPGERHHSLRFRILLWMSLVALGPLVIMSAQGYHCARQAIIELQEASHKASIELGCPLISEIEQKDVVRWLGVLRIRALVTGAVTFIVVLLLAGRTSRALSRPLRKLAVIARTIAEGKHEERLGQLKGKEAQEVGQAFNHMLDELAASQRKLTRAASLAAVGELSSSIVHEMRNPLSSVKLNLQALRKKVKSDADHAELADIAIRQAGRLETMLTDLLGYGKPLELKLTSIKFGDLADGVRDVVREAVEEKSINLEFNDDCGQTEIIADAEQLQRALTNLITNAVYFTPRKGRVLVNGSLVPDNPDQVAISVSDEGPGILSSQMEKLFQPFYTTRPDGTGLGLANVKKIIELHGGPVVVENRSEGGAVFTALLPVGGPPT